MIALDANGAERGPEVAAEGARIAGIEVEIFGPPLPAIGNDEEPALAVRSRPDASVVQAARAVADGRCDGLVSPGPTGATLVSALLHVKRIRGVHRPAIAVLVPVPGKPTLLLDAGANAEVRPEHLVQFAHMGATFMEAVHGVARPRVGLLSIGEEAKKGTPDVIEAHERLAGDETLNFAGNIEGTDVTAGVVDVVVTDGFTGNVALKLMEGTAATVVHAIRETIRSGAVASLGGLLIRRRVGRLRAELDPNATGGAILLGIRKPVVIAHGGSSAEGIANALRLARRAVDEHMIERTAAALETAGALRSAAAASVAESHE
jgi:glycerol-3-phosphate acyltransferase PlsX